MKTEKQTYYFIYKTTNLIDNKFYIGVHKTDKIEDGYLGSGRYLKNAIKSHGKENFKREIFEFCDSYDEALLAEEKHVKLHIENPLCYNLVAGGVKTSFINSVMVVDPHDIKLELFRCAKDHPKYLSGEWVASTIVMRSVKDKEGNRYHLHKDDPRILSGEFVSHSKGKKTVIDDKGVISVVEPDDKRLVSGELKSYSSNKGKAPYIDEEGDVIWLTSKENEMRNLVPYVRVKPQEEIEQARQTMLNYWTDEKKAESSERQKEGYASGRLVPTMLGKNQTDKQKEAARAAQLGKPKSKEQKVKQSIVMSEKKTCPHCGQIGGKSAMTRWHFDNCRHK